MTGVADVPFDYAARDFETIRADMFRRLQTAMPEWEPHESSFETIILELIAATADVMNFYIDRMAAESFVQTAVTRESILNLAAMYGYTPTPQTAALGTVTFTKSAGQGDVFVPAGTQVYAQPVGSEPIVFETVDDHIIEGTSEDINVAEGKTVALEAVGASTGAERQAFALFNHDVIRDSVRVFTQDGPIDSTTGQPTLIEWTYVDRLIDAEFFQRAFVVMVDENDVSYVGFGDSVSGQIPTIGAPILVTYRYGVGAAGNVGAGAITGLVDAGSLSSQIAVVTNAVAMSGGANSESLESMRRNIPRSMRSMDRGVTIEDYSSLALRVGGVGKANASAAVSTSILLAIAPVGGGTPSTIVTDAVQRYVDDRKMIGASVTIMMPVYVPINITVSVDVNPRFRRTVVSKNVDTAIRNVLLFDNVDFGQKVTKAATFRAGINVEGVDVFDITAHNRDGAGDDGTLQMAYNEIPVAGTITINATGGINPL
jgi:uncharacterized phage protein gp47/JayE